MKNSIKFKRSLGLYFLLLPSIIALILFNFIPMYGVLMAFENYNPVKGIWGSTWVGLDNFIQYFKSYQFGKTLWNTFYISMLGILLSFPLPILLALMCNQMRAKMYKKFFQVSTYLPHFTTVVMCGMILLFTSPERGIIAKLLSYIGVTFPNVMGSAKLHAHAVDGLYFKNNRYINIPSSRRQEILGEEGVLITNCDNVIFEPVEEISIDCNL